METANDYLLYNKSQYPKPAMSSLRRKRPAGPKFELHTQQLKRQFLDGKRTAASKPIKVDTSTNPSDNQASGTLSRDGAAPLWSKHLRAPVVAVQPVPMGPRSSHFMKTASLLAPATDTRQQNFEMMEVLRRQRRAEILNTSKFHSTDPASQPDPEQRVRNAKMRLDPSGDQLGNGKRRGKGTTKATLRVTAKRKSRAKTR